MTDGHCILCLRHDTRPRPRGKKYDLGGGGGALIGLPPQQLHSHDTTVSWMKTFIKNHKFIAPGKFIDTRSLRIYLKSFNFYTNCYREWILNAFTYFWCFLELFIGKFIPHINNEHAQDYSCSGATFAFCSGRKKLPRQGGLPVLCNGWSASRSCSGATKNSCELLQASDRTQRQCWPWGQRVARGHRVVPGSCEQALGLVTFGDMVSSFYSGSVWEFHNCNRVPFEI